MAAATVRDVARHAEVSVASVSRALSGSPSVRPAMRARVEASALALGYVPHAGARSLSTARSHAIGVVLPDLFGEFFSEIVRGIDREASALGYQLLLSNIHADPTLAGQAMRAMRGRVDALIVMAPQIDAAVLAAALPPLPTVLVNSPDAAGRHALRVDNRGGAAAMTRHLIDTGRTRIVHFAGDLANVDAQARCEGYRAALGALPALVLEGDFQEESGARLVQSLIASGTDFDAIFAGNDTMALGALQALREAGRAVPGDVAVAGFDDIPLARYLDLSTMRVDMAGIGARAVARAISELEGDRTPAAVEQVATELVVRGTTGGRA